jgi:quercetin dioxygenase-like cupin family protein
MYQLNRDDRGGIAMKILRSEELMGIVNPTPGVRHRLNVLTEEDNANALAGHLSILSPGGDVPYHYHEKRESLIFLFDGELVEIVDGKEFPVKAGDLIYVAAGEKHKMENRSAREARYIEFFTPIVKDFITVT